MQPCLGYKGFFVQRNTTIHWIFGPETVELQKVLSLTAPDSDLRKQLNEDINFYCGSGISR